MLLRTQGSFCCLRDYLVPKWVYLAMHLAMHLE
jgi:hypothetical protein